MAGPSARFSLGRKAAQASGQTRRVGRRAGGGQQEARDHGTVSRRTFKEISEESAQRSVVSVRASCPPSVTHTPSPRYKSEFPSARRVLP